MTNDKTDDQSPAEAHGWTDAADWLERESRAVYGVCLREHAEAAQWLRDTSTASQVQPKGPGDLKLNDPSVQKRLAAQWGYVQAPAPAPDLAALVREVIAAEAAEGKASRGFIARPATREHQRRVFLAWQAVHEALEGVQCQAPAVKDDEPAWELPTPAVGDYVLATKWGDGDPGDNWALGFYTHSDTLQGNEQTRRYYVSDSAGNNIRGNGFRKVHGPIRGDVGRWLLEVASKHLEASPPGVVNLWTMLTPCAFDLERDREPVSQPPVQGRES